MILTEIQGDDLNKTRRIALPFYKQCGAYPESDELSIKAELKENKFFNPPSSASDRKISPIV